MANARTIEFILKAIGDFGDVKGNIDVIQKSLNQLKLNPQLKQNFSNIFADLQKQTAKYQDYLNSGFKTKGDVTGLEKTGNKINALLNQLQTNMNKIDPSVLKESFEIDTTQFEELNNKLKETQNNIDQITSSDNFKSLTGQVDGVVSKLNTLSKSKAISQFQESFKTGNIEQTKIALDKLIENANKFNDEGKKTEYLAYIDKLKTAFDGLSKVDGLQKANDDLKDFSSQLESLGAKQLEELLNAFAQGKIDVQNFVNAVRGYSSATSEAAKKTFEFGSEIDHFKDRAAYFLGLTNSINLFKRALQKALETVKELDAVMTETAVVTDFTVGDMWEKLPEYAAHAKALGSSIKDVYAATTLYYQQGLKTNEAMSVGVETMKMARIANLDAGDATQYMTAALRGFNMEVNELNAQRVNDVYSELAAITAADTSQIATAMSKTASIASAANMEFETTAALLAQIIETTQEAPETAGTALKTIIARFSEVKKLREEGQTTGKDEEGEEIDVNKIQAALRTVNISMDDFFAGTEGLDSILLKLAEKWGSLDFETQRYIATMAAGSRQQSRFIAMMSDYERTMELATAANNSAGASQQQFDKTLDSMEAKLAKLTTAWQEFTMGLANNEILKGAVDTLTFVLNAINKLIDGLSGGNGIAKSVITLNLAIAAIGGLRNALDKLLGSKFIGTIKKVFKQIPIEASSAATQASTNIVDTISSGFQTLEAKSIESGAIAGQGYGQSFSANASQYINDSNIIPSVNKIEGDNQAKGITDDQKTINNTETQKKSLETTNKNVQAQENLEKAQTKTTTSTWRLTGVVTSLVGTTLNWLGTSTLAKDETSALGTAFKNMGTTVSVAGSAISMLAPLLAGLPLGPVLIGIGVLTAAIGVFSAIAKNEYNKSIEGRLEAAQKATEKAKEAAEEAKVAYDALLENKSGYDEIQSSLSELTQGTNEWKIALAEANQQVLQLLETYPQLARFIERGEDGQLIITPQGWENITELISNQVLNTNRMYSGDQISEIALEKETKREGLYSGMAKADSSYDASYKDTSLYIEKTNKAFEEYQNNTEDFVSKSSIAYEDFVNQYKQAHNEQNYQEIERLNTLWNNSAAAQKYGKITGINENSRNAKGEYTSFDTDKNGTYLSFKKNIQPIEEYSAEFTKFAKELGMTAYELSTMRNSFADYDTYLNLYAQKLQIYSEELLSNLDGKAAESEFAQKIASGMAKNYAQSAPDKINEAKTELLTEEGIQKLATELKATGFYDIEDTTGSDETYKQIYEALTGASAEGMDKEALAAEIASYQVSEEWTNKAEALINKLDALAGKDASQAKITAAAISGDIGGLNISEIGELQKFGLAEQMKALGYTDKGEYAKDQGYDDIEFGNLSEEDKDAAAWKYLEQENARAAMLEAGVKTTDLEAVKAFMEENKVQVSAGLQLTIDEQQLQEQIAQQKEAITGQIDAIMGEGHTAANGILNTISVDTLSSLTKQAASMGTEEAKQYIAAFEEVVAKSDNKQTLASYLANVDWSNMTEAAEAMDFMQSMGLDSSEIKKYWDIATDGANAYISSMSEVLALTTRLQTKMADVNDIADNLEDGKATQEQMQKLINAGVDISEFQMTPDGWKATEEQITEATSKLKEYNAEQARLVADQNAQEFSEAQDIWKNATDISQLKQLTQENADGTLSAGIIENMQQARGIAVSLGVERMEDETDEAFKARLQEIYQEYINLLNNGEDIQIMLDKAAAMAEAAKYSTDENVARGGTDESVRYSMMNEASEAGLDANEIIAYSDSLRELGITSQKVRDQIAIDNAKMNQGAKEINDSWDEWEANLSQINTSDYSKALEELKTSTNKLLNINDDLSDSFYKNAQNQKLIKEAAKGNTQALNELQKAAAKEIFDSLSEDSKLSAEYLDKLINTISDTSMAVGEVATLGDAISSNDIAYQLSMMYSDAYYAAIEGGKSVQEAIAIANQAIAAQGFEAPEMVEKEVTVTGDLPDGWTPGPDGNTMLGPDGQPLEGVTWKQNESGTYTYTQTMLVPKAKDSGFTKTQETIGGGSRGKSSGGGGGGGGGSAPKKWENPYDEFYNTVQKLNEELRKRNKLEREYQKLLDKVNTSANDLTENSKKQLESLEAEKKTREGLLENRKKQMEDIESENSKYSDYAHYNEELGVIEIDWGKIEELDGSTDEEFTQGLEDFISQLEDQEKLIEEEIDALDDIYDETKKIREQGEEEYFSFEDRVKEALLDIRQDEIDKLNAINDSINDTNTRLINAMQSSIDKYRQDRDNKKTEEDLADKQRRLAYLQQDTSGANALEIMQLQKEIEEGQEDYTDTLIDQKISELQEQNDKAAEQRERQIQIMEEQLKHYEESGEIWNDVYSLMNEGVDSLGNLIEGSELETLLKTSEGFLGMSELEKVKWLEDLENEVAEGFKWLRVGNSMKTLLDSGILNKGQSITFTTKDGKVVTGTLNEDGSITTSDGNTYKDVYRSYDGTYKTTENYQTPEPPKQEPPKEETLVTEAPKLTEDIKKGVSAAIWNGGYGWGYDPEREERLKEVFGENDIQKNYVNKSVMSGYSGNLSDYSYSNMKKKFKQYKTGGLADFTGPAWLDGTKSKPEYILNADQTKAFFNLVDVLEGLSSGKVQNTQNTGDSIYDIDINVESIGSDYDVEQVASTIKRMINDDARYRNNNAINLQR